MSTKQTDTKSIVLVDDDVVSRHDLANYLRGCGYDVVEAASTDEARTMLSHIRERVSLVLCRAQAAGEIRPSELARLMGWLHLDIPVLLAGDAETAEKAANGLCRAKAERSRPFDPGMVADLVRRRLNDHRPSA